MLCIRSESWRGILLLTAFPLVLSAAGCGDDSGVGKTYPVSGTITFNNEPVSVETTVVLLKPDTSRGNESPFEPAGSVDEDGIYTLNTKGKKGAPPGWYRVIVTATGDIAKHPSNPKHRPMAQSLLPAKYGQAGTTDLQIEVVASPAPGAYDLKLTK